jgi:hypothetical protein
VNRALLQISGTPYPRCCSRVFASTLALVRRTRTFGALEAVATVLALRLLADEGGELLRHWASARRALLIASI